MPYIIAVYDVKEARVARMLKLMRRYLHHVQNWVLEGELTPAQFEALRFECERLAEAEDSVIFYRLREARYADRIVLGVERRETGRML